MSLGVPTVRVLTEEGVRRVPSAELTFDEHLAVINHWRAVFRMLVEPGRAHDGDEEWLAERLAVMDEAERKLRAGEVPYKWLLGPS